LDFDFQLAIEALNGDGGDGLFVVANETRAPGDYVLESLLPEENKSTYHVDGGKILIRSTMVGLVGMDSPYPPGGQVEVSTFLHKTGKLGNHVAVQEETLRAIQDMLLRMRDTVITGNERLLQEMLNFYDKVIIQPHHDTMEWLRGQVLQFGKIDWTYGKVRLNIDYGVPAGNFLAQRTVAGGTAYHLPGSTFWADVVKLRRILKNNVRAFLITPNTADVIRYNPAHNIVAEEGNGTITFRKLVNNGQAFSKDANDVATFVIYDKEGEIISPTDPESTIIVPFLNDGRITAVGTNTFRGYRVGEGSTPNPDADKALGYTHLAPTVEGGSRPGRWGRMYVPQERQWEFAGEMVTNGLPVLLAPNKVASASTEMVP
jgi:hypothetical protein